MGRLSEYDHVEREALRKGISRQPDSLPRGAVVAGEQREAEDLPPTWFCPDCGGAVTWAAAIADLAIAKSDLRAAQERIRALEARLERVRGVVASAVKWQGKTPAPRWADGGVSLWDAVDALTPEDREWAEGES